MAAEPTRPRPSVARDLTVVMPTFRRPHLCSAKAEWIIETWQPAALVVVADGPDPATVKAVTNAAPSALLITLPTNRGAPAAVNAGLEMVRTDWTLRVDDDDQHPTDFPEVLLAQALAQSADVVAAPWLHCGDEPVEQVAARHREHRAVPTLSSAASTFPPDPGCFTTFMHANMLGRTATFQQVRFDETLRGNAWREETDFYLRCEEQGFRPWLTPYTYSWIERPAAGGQRARGRLSYEAHTARNNLRFLRRHRTALGLTSRLAIAAETARFEYGRLQPYLVAGARRARRLVGSGR